MCLLVVLDCTLVYQCPCGVEWFVVGVGNKDGLAHRIVKDVWLVCDCLEGGCRGLWLLSTA